jgi:hypothetical protein
MSTSGQCSSAFHTFDAAVLTGLSSLDLSGAVFAATGMTTGITVYASSTFKFAFFSSVNSLILPNSE